MGTITGDEKTKAMITVSGKLSNIPIEVSEADDNIVFKMQDDGEGGRGLYWLNSAGNYVKAGSLESDNYASNDIGGTIKMRVDGTDLYIRNDGTDA